MNKLLHCYIATLLKNNSNGQVIVILLLLMLLALSIGLAVTQRSITDVATSTQSEQSSRAFSAAEAGIEKALSGTVTLGTPFSLGNDSTATVNRSELLPLAGALGANMAIEYPPIGRETTAQFWFTDPNDPSYNYADNHFDIYFGSSNTSDKPAIELSVLILKTGPPSSYLVKNFYLDSDSNRVGTNKFTPVPDPSSVPADPLCGSVTLNSSILGSSRTFYCKHRVTVEDSTVACPTNPVTSCKLILARVRLLYSTENHPMALAPLNGAQFPPQVQIYNATGIAGQSQKQIQAFKIKDVVPPWFDFALFSVNEIRK